MLLILGDLNVPALVQLKCESTEREDKGVLRAFSRGMRVHRHELIQLNCLPISLPNSRPFFCPPGVARGLEIEVCIEVVNENVQEFPVNNG